MELMNSSIVLSDSRTSRVKALFSNLKLSALRSPEIPAIHFSTPCRWKLSPAVQGELSDQQQTVVWAKSCDVLLWTGAWSMFLTFKAELERFGVAERVWNARVECRTEQRRAITSCCVLSLRSEITAPDHTCSWDSGLLQYLPSTRASLAETCHSASLENCF